MVDRSAQYELLGKLGTGSFGTVWKARRKESGEFVAIKQIDLESSSDDIAEIQQEIALLSECQSNYVTRYYESFITGFRLWIVMEYLAGGSALDAMKDQPFSERQTAVMCRELLSGLAYLHSQGKIHRDIKAANVLLTGTGQVKLADFGVAAQLSSNMSRRHTFVGTPFWMAPEVIKQAGYNYKADIWSLGITAIELLRGEPPLSEFHPMRAIFLIPKSPAPVLQGAFSSRCKDFVSQCLQLDVHKRPTASELLSHPFIKQAGPARILADLVIKEARLPESPVEELALLSMSQGSSGTVRQEQLWEFETIRPGRQPIEVNEVQKTPGAFKRGSESGDSGSSSLDGTVRPGGSTPSFIEHRAPPIGRPGLGDKSASTTSLATSWGAHSTTKNNAQSGHVPGELHTSVVHTGNNLSRLSAILTDLSCEDPSALEALLEKQLAMLRRKRTLNTTRSPIAELLFKRWADDLRRRAIS